MERLFKFFDKNNDGSITVGEFIQGVRGELNACRLKLVTEVFKQLAPSGEITSGDFCAAFDITSVAAYKNGQKTKAAILTELLDQID